MALAYHDSFIYRYGFDPVFRMATAKDPEPVRRMLVENIRGISPNIPFVGHNLEQQTNIEEYLSKPDTTFVDDHDAVVALVDMENRPMAVNSFNRLFLYACQAVIANFDKDKEKHHYRKFLAVPRVGVVMLCYGDPFGLGWPVYHWCLRPEQDELFGLLPWRLRDAFEFSKMELVFINCKAAAREVDALPATSALARLIVDDEIVDESIHSLAEKCLEVQKGPRFREVVEMFSEYLYPLEEQLDDTVRELHIIREQLHDRTEQLDSERQRREAAEAEVQDAKAAKLAAEAEVQDVKAAKLAAEAEVQDVKAAKLAAERVTELMRLLLRDGRIDEATNLDTSTPTYQKLLQEYGLI